MWQKDYLNLQTLDLFLDVKTNFAHFNSYYKD